MTYDEALQYIHGISWTFCKPGLERIGELCEKLGHPERELRFVHVAGTNGKGSFCSMLSSVLTAAGYKTGLYTSPYILRFNERMSIDGDEIADEELAKITSEVRPIADSMQDKPTEFELICAIAFLYFKRHATDVVVLEAGMGGRLDSTNIIPPPLLSVITGVSLDHTAFLGDTVAKIATEKAGIIKSPSPVLFGGTDEEAWHIISERADELGCKLYKTDHSALNVKEETLRATRLDYRSYENVTISLLGSYQPRNAASVLEAVGALRDVGLQIPDSAIKAGLAAARWHARFEIISEDPLTIYDGAHNAEGVAAATESIKRYFGDTRVVAVSGVLKDKDYHTIAKDLSSVACEAHVITPDNPRALPATEYADVLSSYGVPATPHATTESAVLTALMRARELGTAAVCLGSLYIYGEILAAVKKYKGE